MIACVYGRAFAPFVDSAARDLCAAAASAGGEMRTLTLEAVMVGASSGAVLQLDHALYHAPLPMTAWTRTAHWFESVPV